MQAAAQPASIARRYRIYDNVGSGGMGTVYRAFDALSRQMVALKQVLDLSGHLDTRLALAQEFRTLASLRHPNIISVLDYGFDAQHFPFYTMDYLHNAQTFLEAGRDQPLAVQVNLLAQVLRALEYLHRRGIIHRDLKPENVLVVNGQARLVDFGLAAVRGQATEELAGTFMYLAPEIFQGMPPSDKSDLYAAGVLAYQLFTGEFPFDLSTSQSLISAILTTEPDLTRLPRIAPLTEDDPDDHPLAHLSNPLTQVIRKLMAKHPLDRYDAASEVIADLDEALGLPIPPEKTAIRESFLQAASFVGRDEELLRLRSAAEAAISGGGSLWLVAGESGVGKSRLLDEVRTWGMVQGMLVLRGQATREAGSPYQLWADPLRRLVLATELTDAEASVLKPVVPDIELLLARAIPDSSALEPRAAHSRLVNTVVGVFGKCAEPILLILEDLHWAENLDILKALSALIHGQRLTIIASYRDDELPELPAQVSGAQVVKLHRLARDGIIALSQAMIGAAAQHSAVIDLLQRESEGNIFFLVEVVRALAEEAGEFSQIGAKTLPEQVFAGGVRALVQRRLSRVPEAYWPLLEIAAIMGREIDQSILHAIDPTANLSDWLTTCANAAVFEVQDDQWQFVHNKLRDGLLDSIPEDKQRSLHYKIALTIERVYPNVPTYMVALSYHFEKAGIYEEAIDYLRRAADNAARAHANDEAMNYYARAINLVDRSPVEPEIVARTYEGLGDMFVVLGEYESATETYLLGAQHAGPELSAFHRAILHRKKGQAFEKWGRYDEAAQSFDAGMVSAAEALHAGEASHLYVDLAMLSLQRGNLDDARDFARIAHTIAVSMGNQPIIAEACHKLGIICWMRGEFQQALEHNLRSLAAWEAEGDLNGQAAAHNNLGLVYESQGNSDQAILHLRRSVALCEKMGNRHGTARACDNLARVYRRSGQRAQAIEPLEKAVGILVEIGRDEVQVYVTMWQSGAW